jgi:predicted transcriptional regulator
VSTPKKKPGPTLAEAIRETLKEQGIGIEEFCRKHEIAPAHFYKLLRGRDPVPDKVKGPLLRLKSAGVKHPLLDLVA